MVFPSCLQHTYHLNYFPSLHTSPHAKELHRNVVLFISVINLNIETNSCLAYYKTSFEGTAQRIPRFMVHFVFRKIIFSVKLT